MLASLTFRTSTAAPRYPEKISVNLPKGMRSAIERAAARENITPPELMRRALAEKAAAPKKDA